MKTIIWDWNGTLLDDVQVGYDATNALLRAFDKPELKALDDYRAAFGFPIERYYEHLGLGGALFTRAADVWMREYLRRDGKNTLRGDARAVLAAFQAAGCPQVILSASKRELLLRQIERFGIASYFDEVLGLSHIYATSKEGIGRAWLERSGVRAQDCVMLGDTTHDFEVATALGFDCILVENGHQRREALRSTGATVAQSLTDALHRVLG